MIVLSSQECFADTSLVDVNYGIASLSWASKLKEVSITECYKSSDMCCLSVTWVSRVKENVRHVQTL